MSINITVHDNNVKGVRRKEILCDPSRTEKELNYERRKLRLEQVRQQSKELASKIRKKVICENQRQLKRIENAKRCELVRWREKTLGAGCDEYNICLQGIGAAHKAAHNENISQDNIQKSREKNKILAEKRGKDALKRIHEAKSKQSKKLENQGTNVKLKANVNNGSSASRKTYTVCGEKKEEEKSHVVYPEVNICDMGESSSSSCSDSDDESTSDTSEEEVEHEESCKCKKLTCTRPIIFDVASNSDLSSISLEDVHETANMHFSRMTSGSSPKKKKQNDSKEGKDRNTYNPEAYKGTDLSSEKSHKVTKWTKSGPFTQVSELLRRCDTKSIIPETRTPSPRPKSPNKAQTPEKICQSPTKQAPKKASPTRNKSRSPQRDCTTKTRATSLDCPKSNLSSKGNTSKQTSTKSLSMGSSGNRVQFYDYNTKYEKEYDSSNIALVRRERKKCQPSAMENAREEMHKLKQQEEQNECRRERTEKRSRLAQEKEQIRRDCEALTQKLGALSRDKISQICGTDGPSPLQIEQKEKNKQKKITSAIEEILECPVIITCPEVAPKKRTTHINNIVSGDIDQDVDDNKGDEYPGVNVDTCLNHEEFNGISTSDSCASILLNYVESQKEKVREDIGKCESTTKCDQLKSLLEKINGLRLQLLNALNQINDPGKKPEMQKVIDKMTCLCKERDDILSKKDSKDTYTEQSDMEEREKELKKREEMLEQKLKEIYQQDIEVVSVDKSKPEKIHKVSGKKPVRIIIEVADDTPTKSPGKRSTLIDKKPVKTKRKPIRPSKKATSPEKIKPVTIITSPRAPQSETSTSYYSPPSILNTSLKDLLDKCDRQKNKKDICEEKALCKKTPQNKEQLNTALNHYIKRLLGMSRNSIQTLGVSSSEVETPCSSIINASANVSSPDGETRMEKLKKFMNENYSLLSEIEDSINKSVSTLTDDSSRTGERSCETAWNKKLPQPSKEKKLTPILKPCKQKKKTKHVAEKKSSPKKLKPTSARRDEVCSPKSLPVEPIKDKSIVNKYSELTEHCSKRIEELTDMINKVRKEKQKILEITLSSSSTDRNSTEYMNLPDGHDANKTCSSGEEVHLEKHKLTGMSRDSGISLSRPLTALDHHEPIDSRALQKTIADQRDAILQAIKDIPRVPSPKKSVPSDPDDSNKRHKPPSSLVRFSPLLSNEEHPHELSTIAEVETPATSRHNATQKDKSNISHKSDNIKYNKFPTFEQYAREHNLDLSKFDCESTLKLENSLQELIELSSTARNIKYNEFPSLRTYLHNLGDSTLSAPDSFTPESIHTDIAYRQFPSHKSYCQQLGETGLLDSQCIEAASILNNNAIQTINSEESLPDVVAELKRRKMIARSFYNESGERPKKSPPKKQNKTKLIEKQCPCPPETSNTSPSSGTIEKDLQEMGMQWASRMMKKSQKSTEINDSTSSSLSPKQLQYLQMQKLLEVSSKKTSPKRSPSKAYCQPQASGSSPQPKSSSRTSSPSKSNRLSPRKTSTSQDNTCPPQSVRNSSSNRQSPSTTQSSKPEQESEGGMRINLRDFLAREIEKSSSTMVSSDGTILSEFARTIRGISLPSSSDQRDIEMIRTSTPVSGQPHHSTPRRTDTSKFFSGDSCLSSVRLSSNSKSGSKHFESSSSSGRNQS